MDQFGQNRLLSSRACHDKVLQHSQQGYVWFHHSGEELAILASSFCISCLDHANDMQYILLALDGDLSILASILSLIPKAMLLSFEFYCGNLVCFLDASFPWKGAALFFQKSAKVGNVPWRGLAAAMPRTWKAWECSLELLKAWPEEKERSE